MRIDSENQRLLRAIVGSKPEVQYVHEQLDNYEQITVKYKLRRERLAAQDPAQKIMRRKRDMMNRVQSKLPELTGVPSQLNKSSKASYSPELKPDANES